MSITPLAGQAAPARRAPSGRVRHQAREAAAVMAFSLATSVGLATSLLLLAHLGR